MREVMKKVEDCGVYFNVEVVNRFEQYLLNTCEEALEYVKAVGSPNCKILLDTFHMNIEEDSFTGAIERAGSYLGHMHIGETNRRAPGCGKMAWDEIFQALKKIGYSGAIVMEPFLIPGGEIGRDIKIYRSLEVEDLDVEAKRALDFVRGELK
jgi:D-psicose/D-tagatose/L-ribulose 3-epimerase